MYGSPSNFSKVVRNFKQKDGEKGEYIYEKYDGTFKSSVTASESCTTSVSLDISRTIGLGEEDK